MKTIQKFSCIAGIFLPSLALAQAVAPQIPVGTLAVNRNFLREGTSPTLTWAATYPQPATETVKIDDKDTATTTKEVKVTVRVAGVAFQSGSQLLTTKMDMKVGSGNWTQKFIGASTNVNPQNPVYEQVVPANTAIDFKFQGASGKKKSNASYTKVADWNWYPEYATGTTSKNKIALFDGDPVPSYAPAYSQGNIKSFLKSYLSADGKTVDIGPRDVIYLTELATSDTKASYFDMQDLVIVVTYDDVTK
jgi:hypothetical protein